MKLGETIYRLRVGKNLSQGELADLLDVSRQSVSKWENNAAVPDLDKLVKLSGLFGVTLDELVNGGAAEKTAEEKPPEEAAQPRQEEPSMEEFACGGTVTAPTWPELPAYTPGSEPAPAMAPKRPARPWSGVAAVLLALVLCAAAAMDLANLSAWVAAESRGGGRGGQQSESVDWGLVLEPDIYVADSFRPISPETPIEYEQFQPVEGYFSREEGTIVGYQIDGIGFVTDKSETLIQIPQ